MKEVIKIALTLTGVVVLAKVVRDVNELKKNKHIFDKQIIFTESACQEICDSLSAKAKKLHKKY